MTCPAITDSKADDSKAGLRVGMLVDMAYSDGDVREAVEAAGAELVAKVPPMSNSGRFPKTDFVVDLDADILAATCPADVTTTTTVKTNDHKGRPTLAFAFPAATCAACPLRQQCVKGSRGRQVRVSVHEQRIAAARTAQTEDPDTMALLRARAKVERKIDHLQDLGMRQARYRGRRKTRLQAVLAAIVANVIPSRCLGRVRNCPQHPDDGTGRLMAGTIRARHALGHCKARLIPPHRPSTALRSAQGPPSDPPPRRPH